MMNSRKLKAILIISVFIVGFLLTYNFYMRNPLIKQIEKKVKSFNVSIVDECENLMLKNNLVYALCRIRNGNVYLSDIISFSPGEYVGLQVNLKMLDIPFDYYYTCAYSDLPRYETSYPARYGESKPQIYVKPFVFCSPLFYKNDYHHWALSAFVLNIKGQYKIMEIYVFNGSLPKDFNFKDNLDKGIKVFELRGRIV